MRVTRSIYRYLLSIAAVCLQLGSAYAQSNSTSLYEYGAGTTTLTEDYGVYYGSSVPTEITIKGVSGGGTIIDGNQNHGYQFQSNTKATTITVKDIDAFINFKDTVDDNRSTLEGGAVFYIAGGAKLQFEGYSKDKRILFEGDNSVSDGNDNDGGALSVQDNGVVGDVYADFTNNHAVFPDDLYPEGTVLPDQYVRVYARGGAINVGGSTGKGTMGDVYGNFTNNSAEFGGAIYVGLEGSIGDVEGTFFANYATAGHKEGGETGGSAGGAIRVYRGTIGSISGVFDSNATYASQSDAISAASTAQGGAIALNGAKFHENATINAEVKNNISYSETANAYGGGIFLYNQGNTNAVYITDSNIIGNSAATQLETTQAYGGGYYIDLSDSVYIDAKNQDVLMRNNMEIVGGTFDETGKLTAGTREYNAIYSKNSTIYLRAYNDTNITIDDGIESAEKSNLVLDSTSSEQYDISLNAEIRNMDVLVKNGGLILGSYTHDHQGAIETTTATFKGGTLTVEAGDSAANAGVVNTAADNLNGADAISNRGTIEFTGGSLSKGINDVSMAQSAVSAGAAAGAKTGSLHINAKTTFTNDIQVYSDSILLDDRLIVATAASVDVNTLLYQAANMTEINSLEHIVLAPDATLSFDKIRLEIDTASSSDFFDLIVSDGSGYSIAGDYSMDFSVEFTLGGRLLLRDIDYIVAERPEDGGLRIHFTGDSVIPEPSSATLSLLALSALMMRRRRRY